MKFSLKAVLPCASADTTSPPLASPAKSSSSSSSVSAPSSLPVPPSPQMMKVETTNTSVNENPTTAEREVHMYQFPSQRSWAKPRGMKENSTQNRNLDEHLKAPSTRESRVASTISENDNGVSQSNSSDMSGQNTEILVDIGGEYLVSVHQVKALGAVLKMASGELGKLFFDEVSLSVYNVLSLI